MSMSIALLLSLVASVLFLTLYGAGIYAWSVLLVATVLSIMTWLAYRQGRPSTSNSETQTPLYPLVHVALIGFVILTLLPLPKALSIVTGSRRYQQNSAIVEVLKTAENLELCDDSLRLFSTSRNRAGSLRVLLLLAVMFCAFEAVRFLSPAHRIVYLHILIAIGITVAVLGYVSTAVFPQGNKLWWLFPVPPFHRQPVGSFLNANHYAGFVAMLGATALGATMLHLRRRRWFWAAATTLAALTMAIFVVLSASRGAILAFTAGLGAVAIALLCHLKGRIRLVGIITIAIAAILAAGMVFQNDTVRTRLSTLRHPITDTSLQPRLSAWKGALKMWTYYPLEGVGANAFRFTYPQHKDASNRAFRRFAENEFIHILCEGGLIGILLTVTFLASIVNSLRRSLQSPTEEENASCSVGRLGQMGGLAICSVAAITVGAVHASVDFILHLPLYAITLASLAALGVRYTTSTKRHRIAIATTAIVTICLIPTIGPMTHYDASAYMATRSFDKLATLLTWAPTNSQLWRRFGAMAVQQKTEPSLALAERCLERAAQYDPCDFNIWTQLGKLRLERGDKAAAREAFARATAIRSWAPVPKIPPDHED